MIAHLPEGHLPPVHLPWGHLPGFAIPVIPCELYNLFPAIIRMKSLLASNLIEETDTQESIFKKVTYALEMECAITRDQIEDLMELLDADACPSAFLPLLASYLCIEAPSTLPIGKRRMVIKAAVLIWMVKGMHISWEALLRLRGMAGYLPWELWKRNIYETFDYSEYPTYYHTLKSARFDFTLPDDPYDKLPAVDLDRWMAVIDSVRPIHVLPRPYDAALIVDRSATDQMVVATDSLTFDTELIPIDTPDELEDELTPLATCISWCEASCQAGTEYICASGCETGCQTLSETTCWTYAESGCALSCEMSCETSCEHGSCETGCEAGCEVSCETGIETGV